MRARQLPLNGQKREQLLAVLFFSSRRRHTRCSRDWSSDVCSSDLLPCSKNEVSRMSMCRPHSNICGTSSSQLTARSTAFLKARRASACVVAMKTIGQCWPPRLGWHVRYGRKMQTSSEPASRRGQQIASRFFSRHRQSQPDPRRAENPIARLNAKKKFCANDVIPAYENYFKRVLDES